MMKTPTVTFCTALSLNEASDMPLYRQLYDGLRMAILNGQLKSGTRLQSTRELAVELGISRNTVLTAFEQLLAEGYLEGKTGSGTFVSSALPEELLAVRVPKAKITQPSRAKRNLSKFGAALAETDIERSTNVYLSATANHLANSHAADEIRAFRAGTPALDTFPNKLWSQLTTKHWHNPPATLLSYSDAAGYQPLREAVADYLRTSRGVHCEAEQIIITAGAQQALDVTARLLLNAGDAVWIENPGYLGARAAFLSAGAQLIPLPVDEDGLSVAIGEKLSPEARLVYVTPSHQYPTGVAISLARRLTLLEWANRTGAWIIEDDYDSEYRYAGRPLPAMQGLDKESRVIYIGTFSKVLFPALRVGYVVAPPDLTSAFIAARGVLSRFTPSLEQAVIADFILEGHFARHIRRMRTLYAERQEALLRAAKRDLQGLLDVQSHQTGMHLVGLLPDGVNDREAAIAAAKQQVEVQPMSLLSLGKTIHNGLILGYAAYNERQIQASVKRLAIALHDMIPSRKH